MVGTNCDLEKGCNENIIGLWNGFLKGQGKALKLIRWLFPKYP